jgi:hypothetical protein
MTHAELKNILPSVHADELWDGLQYAKYGTRRHSLYVGEVIRRLRSIDKAREVMKEEEWFHPTDSDWNLGLHFLSREIKAAFDEGG